MLLCTTVSLVRSRIQRCTALCKLRLCFHFVGCLQARGSGIERAQFVGHQQGGRGGQAAQIVHVSISFIHNLCIQKFLQDVLYGYDANCPAALYLASVRGNGVQILVLLLQSTTTLSKSTLRRACIDKEGNVRATSLKNVQHFEEAGVYRETWQGPALDVRYAKIIVFPSISQQLLGQEAPYNVSGGTVKHWYARVARLPNLLVESIIQLLRCVHHKHLVNWCKAVSRGLARQLQSTFNYFHFRF